MLVPERAAQNSTRPLWLRAGLLTASFVALLYVIEAVDVATGLRLDNAGIEPREVDGLRGIAFAPLLHHGWDHLFANTGPILVLGFVVMMSGIGRGLAATAVIWIVGGFGTWLTGGALSIHVGASGLVFGWLAYLIVRGVFTRSLLQLLLGVLVLLVYGSVLWGVLPGQEGISWQGHLFGAVGGVIAAWVLASDVRRARRTGDSATLAPR
ncbi:rhomboid family intramembrane serine protease [Rhodococcoides trifolii]